MVSESIKLAIRGNILIKILIFCFVFVYLCVNIVIFLQNNMQNPHPKLNFPPINSPLKVSGTTLMVWDSLRRSYLVLTPEEWVRRHLVEFLLSELSIPAAQIVQEYPVKVNSQSQRADVVVLSTSCEVVMMVECKAYDVKLSQSTLNQAVRYNSVLRARYIMLTNGLSHRIYERLDDEGNYRGLSSLSELKL